MYTVTIVTICAALFAGCGQSTQEKLDQAIREQIQRHDQAASASLTTSPTGATGSAGSTQSSGGKSTSGDNSKQPARRKTPEELRAQIESRMHKGKGDITRAQANSLKIGESKSTVRRKLGSPISVRTEHGLNGENECWTYDLLAGQIITVCFDENNKLAEVNPY